MTAEYIDPAAPALEDKLIEQIHAIRNGSDVRRYHTRRVLRQQTVGQHSHGVARLVALLHPGCTSAAIVAALDHDLAEFFTGDTPATAKWTSPELNKILGELELAYEDRHGLVSCGDLDLTEAALVKFCDVAELAFFSIDEYNMGNRYAVEFLLNVRDFMQNRNRLLDRLPRVQRVALYLIKIIDNVEKPV